MLVRDYENNASKKILKLNMEIQSVETAIETYKHSLEKLNDLIYKGEDGPNISIYVIQAEKITEDLRKLRKELEDLNEQVRELEDPQINEANKDYYTGMGKD